MVIGCRKRAGNTYQMSNVVYLSDCCHRIFRVDGGDRAVGPRGGDCVVRIYRYRNRAVGSAGRALEFDIAANSRLARSHLEGVGRGHEARRHIGEVYVLGHRFATVGDRTAAAASSQAQPSTS